MKRFDIIYADPPWNYKGQTQHNGIGGVETGGAAVHYPTMTLKELKRLDVASLAADDCLLFMWITNPHFDQGVDLMRAWGFKWATIGFVWDKQRVNPGFYTMSQCEMCVIGKRGKIPQPRGQRNVRQLVSSMRRKHSQKPDEVRDAIQKMFPTQTKLELFARERVDGWSVFGNELVCDVDLKSIDAPECD